MNFILPMLYNIIINILEYMHASYWFFQSLSLFFFLLLSLDSFILSFSISHGSQERVDDSKEVLWLVLWGILSKELTYRIKLLKDKGGAKILTSTNNRQTVVHVNHTETGNLQILSVSNTVTCTMYYNVCLHLLTWLLYFSLWSIDE